MVGLKSNDKKVKFNPSHPRLYKTIAYNDTRKVYYAKVYVKMTLIPFIKG